VVLSWRWGSSRPRRENGNERAPRIVVVGEVRDALSDAELVGIVRPEGSTPVLRFTRDKRLAVFNLPALMDSVCILPDESGHYMAALITSTGSKYKNVHSVASMRMGHLL